MNAALDWRSGTVKKYLKNIALSMNTIFTNDRSVVFEGFRALKVSPTKTFSSAPHWTKKVAFGGIWR